MQDSLQLPTTPQNCPTVPARISCLAKANHHHDAGVRLLPSPKPRSAGRAMCSSECSSECKTSPECRTRPLRMETLSKPNKLCSPAAREELVNCAGCRCPGYLKSVCSPLEHVGAAFFLAS